MSAETFKLILITDVFRPSENTEVRKVVIQDNKPLSFYLDQPIERYTLAHNRKEMGGDFVPKRNDEVVATLVPLGGDNAKSILRFASVLALAKFAPLIAGKSAGLFFGAGSAAAQVNTFTSIATLGVQIAGSALINNLLPISQEVSGGLDDSPSYGLDGAKATSAQGIPVPLVYGKTRQSGNVVGYHVDNEGDNKNQYVTILLCLGEAPCKDITDVEINNQPIEDYTNWTYAAKLNRDVSSSIISTTGWDVFETSIIVPPSGLTGDAAVSHERGSVAPRIDNAKTFVPVSTAITETDVIRTTSATVDRFRIDITAPSGLGRLTQKNKAYSESVPINIDYKRTSSTVWTPLIADVLPISNIGAYYAYSDGTVADRLYENHDVRWNGNTGVISTTQYAYKYPDDPKNTEIATSRVTAGIAYRNNAVTTRLAVSGKSSTTLRFSILSPELPEDIYDIRVRRLTAPYDNDEFATDDVVQDSLIWADLVEIEKEKIGYQGSCMLAVRALLTDQLNSTPQITCVNHGRIISVWNGGPDKTGNWVQTNSDNPAWITWDIFTNEYGLGLDPDRLDLLAWKRWADFCDDNDLSFRGIFDTNSNIWDALQIVFRAGRAQIVPAGILYSVAIEGPRDPVMSFGNGNIKKGSLNYKWHNVADRANEVEVFYYDEDNKYKESVVKVVDNTRLSENPKLASIRMPGIVTQDRAIREGTLQLNLNKLIRQSVSFEAPLEAIGLKIGDDILVAHDHALWSFSGRLKSYTEGTPNSTIVLDQEITMEVGTNYALLVHSPYIELGTEYCNNVSGTRAFFTTAPAQIGYISNLVAQIGSEEYPIIGNDQGWYQVNKDLPSFTAGTMIRFFQTDSLDEYDVIDVTAAVTTDTIQVVGPVKAYSYSHTDDRSLRNFMFGEIQNVGKQFRVKSLRRGADDYHRKIECTEYQVGAYDDTQLHVVPPTQSLLPDYITVVNNLVLKDSYRLEDGFTKANVALSWDVPTVGLYEGAIIYGSINGGEVQTLGRTSGKVTSWEMDYDLNDYIVVRVVAYDFAGNSAPFASSPFEAVFLNRTITLPIPENLTTTAVGTKITLAWTYPTSGLIGDEGVQIYRGPNTSFEEATLITETQTALTSHEDIVAPGAVVYYWVRFSGIKRERSLSGFNGPVSGTTDSIDEGSKTYTANSDSPPTVTGVGDLWYQPDTGITMRSSDGVNWDEEFDSRYAYLPDSSPLPDPNFNLTAGGQDAFWQAIDVTSAGITFSNNGQDNSGSAKIETYSNTAAELKLVTKQYFPANGTDKYHVRMIYQTPNGNQIPNFDVGMRFYDRNKNLVGTSNVFSVAGSGGTGGVWNTLAPNTIASPAGAYIEQVAYARPFVHAVGNSTTNKEMTISSIEFEKAKDVQGIVDNAISDTMENSVASHVIKAGTATGNGVEHYPVYVNPVQVPQNLTGHYVEMRLSFSAHPVTDSVRVRIGVNYQENGGTWTNPLDGAVANGLLGGTMDHFLIADDNYVYSPTFVPIVPQYRSGGIFNSYTARIFEPNAGPFAGRVWVIPTTAEPNWETIFDNIKLELTLVKK